MMKVIAKTAMMRRRHNNIEPSSSAREAVSERVPTAGYVWEVGKHSDKCECSANINVGKPRT